MSRPPAPGGRGNVAALVAIVVVAAALYWVMSAIRHHNAVQDCIDSGRQDCVALPTSPGQ